MIGVYFIFHLLLMRYVPDAACAVNAASHDGLDEGADVLVFNGALPTVVHVGKPRSIRPKGHRLVLVGEGYE